MEVLDVNSAVTPLQSAVQTLHLLASQLESFFLSSQLLDQPSLLYRLSHLHLVPAVIPALAFLSALQAFTTLIPSVRSLASSLVYVSMSSSAPSLPLLCL